MLDAIERTRDDADRTVEILLIVFAVVAVTAWVYIVEISQHRRSVFTRIAGRLRSRH